MKKLILIGLTILNFCVSGWATEPSSTEIFTINLGVTNMAANATNTTAGQICWLPQNGEARTLMLTARAEGVAATTNGVTSVSNIVFKIAVSHDGVNFTEAINTQYKVSVPAPGYTTNYFNDWTFLPGIKAIKAVRTENNTFGAISNLYLQGSYNH